jgi:hypothetical protein
MKRFTVVTSLFSVSFLIVWVVFQASVPPPAKTNTDHTRAETQDAPGDLMKTVDSNNESAVPVTGAEVRMIAPVFDSTGAVVSDPTGTIWNATHSDNLVAPAPSAKVQIAPVYDATGQLISDPTGTIWSAAHSSAIAAPALRANAKIAPVYDATGTLVSDPTGTIWSAVNP